MRKFFAAIRFLTVLPVPGGWGGDEKTLARSVSYFPLAGLVIGLIAAGFDYAVGLAVPLLPASTLTILVLIGLTGGLHMDGLADTADGFFSARPRDKMMEIMRDSRTGVMGVLAVVFVVLLKVTLLADISVSSRWVMILIMPLAGRAAVIALMTALPYARPQGGLATLFAGSRSWLHVLWAWVLLFAVAGGLAQGIGFAAAFLALVITVFFILYNRGMLGGYTGDTLGAVCELVEMAPLLAAVMYYHLWVR
jgi:adenosylcobinamide-GDP ribazoletransferase